MQPIDSGKRIFHGVVGIDVLASDFGASLDDSALAVKLQQRSSQCVSYDFNIPEGANVVTRVKLQKSILVDRMYQRVQPSTK